MPRPHKALVCACREEGGGKKNPVPFGLFLLCVQRGGRVADQQKPPLSTEGSKWGFLFLCHGSPLPWVDAVGRNLG